jgi:hypothetical protein
MAQADFSYAEHAANDGAAIPLAVSIFVDRPHLREDIRKDTELAGLQVIGNNELLTTFNESPCPIGEIVIVDCPVVSMQKLSALSRLNERAKRIGSCLIVSTVLESLDDVFACLGDSDAQLLVDPDRAERVLALGVATTSLGHSGVRELNEDDRLLLFRLTQQVGRIAQRLERLSASDAAYSSLEAESGAFRFESPVPDFNGEVLTESKDRLVRAARPPLPDPRLIRRIIRQRQLRARFFDADLFADPAWDMLLDLTAARVEHTRVSITSLCIASGVPPTTALRWISQMIEAGLFERMEDEADRRRAFITLTDKAADAMARYFRELGKGATHLV